MDRTKIEEIKNIISDHKAFVLVIFFALFLLTYKLGEVPVHINQDELEFALNAQSISEDLYDQNGKYLPFYFWHLDAFWATPVIVYITSVVQVFTDLSEFSVRLSSVFVGLVSMLLIYLLSQEIFKNRKYALLSSVFMFISPVFFIHSRILLDNIYPVPFILLWLLLIKKFTKQQNKSHLFWAGISLGVGLHSYHAAKLMMPLYFFLTFVYLFFNKIRARKYYIYLTLGFLIPILLFLPWLQKHPDTLLNQVSYAGSIDQSIEVERGLAGVFNTTRIKSFSKSYISYFGGKILFTEGDYSQIHSTRKTGAFLFVFSLLLLLGIIETLKRKDLFSKVVLLGFLMYPIAPSIVNEPQRISRGLVVIPFAVLLFVYGVNFMFESKEKHLRSLFVLIAFLSAFQFVYFVNDYLRYYPMRSYNWFNNDIGGGLESVLNSTKIRDVERVYLDDQVIFMPRYHKFYQEKNNINVNSLTNYFDPRKQDFTEFGPGSIVLVRSDHIQRRPPDRIGDFEKIETIREPDGSESFYVYYREI